MKNARTRLFGILLALMLMLGLSGFAIAESAPAYVDVSPEVAYALMGSVPDLVVIDVSPMYKQMHLPGAISHLVADGSLTPPFRNWTRTRPTWSTARRKPPRLKATKLTQAGFEKVFRLQGGTRAGRGGLPGARYRSPAGRHGAWKSILTWSLTSHPCMSRATCPAPSAICGRRQTGRRRSRPGQGEDYLVYLPGGSPCDHRCDQTGRSRVQLRCPS